MKKSKSNPKSPSARAERKIKITPEVAKARDAQDELDIEEFGREPVLIKRFRQQKNLTQRELARKCEISQQHLQLLETGISPIRLEPALRICNALGTPIEMVFPALAAVFKKYPGEKVHSNEAIEALAEAGLELDGAVWTAEFGLQGGTAHQFNLSSADKDRLRGSLQAGDDDERESAHSFFSFSSELYSVCVNLKQLSYTRLLFDGPSVEDLAPLTYERVLLKAPNIRVWRTGSKECLEFHSNVDDPEEEGEADGEYEGRLNSLLLNLDSGLDDSIVSFVHFEDSDGEEVFLRVRDVALICVPHWMLNSDILGELDEDELDGDNDTGNGEEPPRPEATIPPVM